MIHFPHIVREKKKEKTLQILPKHCINDDFNVIPERPIIQILYIDFHFIRKQHFIIVLLRVFLLCQQ